MASTTYNSNTTLDTPLTATHTHPCETQALATVVAQTILYLQQHHHKVTVSHNSSKLTKAYEQYLELPIRRRVHHPNHGALFVLSQPTIDIIEDPDVSPNQSSATATICNALTLTWPIYAQINTMQSTDCLKHFIASQLDITTQQTFLQEHGWLLHIPSGQNHSQGGHISLSQKE